MTRHLHTLAIGTAGPRVAFLHGLFGQGRNWSQIAKGLAGPDGSAARCLLVDLPDHGRSARSDSFSFVTYATAVAETLRAAGGAQPWVVVGHSLGGKTAMTLALVAPTLVDRLAVVDIAPKSYGDLHRFNGYIEAMRAMPLERIDGRAEADAVLARIEPDPGVRAFLLQNLRRHGDGWTWQVNLELVAADAARGNGSRIAGFPFHPGERAAYPGPVLWLVGAQSEYVQDEDVAGMRAMFPRVRLVRVKGAGHWVHTDAPEVTVQALRRLVGGADGGAPTPGR